MATLKSEEIRKMNKDQRNKKLEELKLELVKARVAAQKGGSSKVKEIKRIISRIHTINTNDKEVLNSK